MDRNGKLAPKMGVTKLWLPLLCILSGILITKLVELSYTDWQGHSRSLPELNPVSSLSSDNSTSQIDRASTFVGRENAAFVVLTRNSDLYGLAKSIRSVEDRFNHKYAYDWVFLNDVAFTEEFKNVTSTLVSGRAKYGWIQKKHWSYPEWIDQSKAAAIRERAADEYMYGGSESYRHMCRWFSGFFFQHSLLLQYDYYWRVEPDIELWCDINFDPFKFMRENKKKISFVITLPEIELTIPSLWKTVKEFFKKHPKYLAKENSMQFLSDDGGKTYNGCHFWSNFEIGSFDWLRSPEYLAFFDHLDQAGGFFYERWGDAPVHSIAAGLLLNRTDIHYFNEIGYSHGLYTHCPTGTALKKQLKCYCSPAKNFDWGSLSCLPTWYKMQELPMPEGYKEELILIEEEDRKSLEVQNAYRAEDDAYEAELEQMASLLAEAKRAVSDSGSRKRVEGSKPHLNSGRDEL